MKKIISLLLTLVLLAVLTVPAAAVDPGQDDSAISVKEILSDLNVGQDDDVIDVEDLFDQPTLIIGKADCQASAEANISVTFSANPGICAAVFHIAYDTAALRVSEVTSAYFDASYKTDATGATVSLYHLSGNVTVSEPVAQITFLSLGVKGTYPLTVSYVSGSVANYNEEAVELSLMNGQIVVGCDHYYAYDRTEAATCSAKGRIIYSCRKCGLAKETELEMLPHTSGEWRTVQEPNCTEPGENGHYCAVCNQVYETTPIKAVGHTYGSWFVDEPAGCTKEGTQVRICAVCSHEETAPITPTGHGNAVWKTTDPAGCTAGGTASRVCNDCGETLETKTIPPTGHLYQWVDTTVGTCSVKGLQSYMCVICGEVKETKESDFKAHTAGEWRVKTPATCGKAGTEELHCALCDAVMDTRPVTALTHVEDRITVVKAPTANEKGLAEYRCKQCGEVLRTEELAQTSARLFLDNVSARAGETVRIPVNVINNPGFAAGLVKINYSITDLIYEGYELGTVVKENDVTVGCPQAGQINLLLYTVGSTQLNGGTNKSDGVILYLKFTVTEQAKTSTVRLTVDPNSGFFNNQTLPKPVFFVTGDGIVSLQNIRYGDVDGDGNIDTTDLASLKKELAGLIDLKDLSGGADCNGDGVVDTTDLSLLKKYLAGLIDEKDLGPVD